MSNLKNITLPGFPDIGTVRVSQMTWIVEPYVPMSGRPEYPAGPRGGGVL